MKIHTQLGHCSGEQLADLLRFGGCKVDQAQIRRVSTKCNCQQGAHRIAPPVVPSWISRFSGEVVALGIVHPFTEIGPGGLPPLWKNTGNIVSLLVADSHTSFTSRQIPNAVNSGIATQVFANDQARRFGKPKRIFLGQGGPVLGGWEWEELSHIFGWQYARAPVRTPPSKWDSGKHSSIAQGRRSKYCAKREARSISPGALSAFRHRQESRPSCGNRTSPAFAMTGRCDIVSGAIACMWEHDPMSRDPLTQQMTSLCKIMEAGNAIILAYSTHAIRTCLSRNLLGNGDEHFPIGPPVQLSLDSKWLGKFRVIAHSTGNLLVGGDTKSRNVQSVKRD